MTPIMHRAALATLIAAALAAPAWADSTSSASSAASQSVGSISGSIERSSQSSSGDRNVAEGEYRIIEVAEVDGQPGTQRLTLQAVKADGAAKAADEFFLYVPQPVIEQGKLAAGGTVLARHKPYGLEFAHAKTLKGFFMALKDEWYRELQTRPVSL